MTSTNLAPHEAAEASTTDATLLGGQTPPTPRHGPAIGIGEVQSPGGLGDVFAAIAKRHGLELDGKVVHHCDGGCGLVVAKRGDWCAPCGVEAARAAHAFKLRFAQVSLDPRGDLTWCRPATAEYTKATSKALEIARRLPEKDRAFAVEFIGKARWKRADGGVLIVGDTGIGKSKALVANGLRILDESGSVPDGIRFASGIRFVSGLDLAKAWAKQKLGEGEPPLMGVAKSATLLLLDEIGYEERRFDPHAVRDVLHHRYDRGLPTLTTSGRTLNELEEVYGGATLRRLYERGHTINLHEEKR